MKDEEAIEYLESLVPGQFCTVNIPIYSGEFIASTCIYLGKDDEGRYSFKDDNCFKMSKEFLVRISFFNILKKFERPLYYQFIELKYIKKLDNKEIMKQLKLNEVALKNLEIQVKWIAYRYAIKEELFKEEVLENVPV